jgi:hypothetical protein
VRAFESPLVLAGQLRRVLAPRRSARRNGPDPLRQVGGVLITLEQEARDAEALGLAYRRRRAGPGEDDDPDLRLLGAQFLRRFQP